MRIIWAVYDHFTMNYTGCPENLAPLRYDLGSLDVSPHRLLPGYFFLSYECKILASILHVFDHKLTRPIFILLHVCVLHCFHV